MPDNNISPELLEPFLPGALIAEHRHIWQMNLLNARELARFSKDRSLSFSSEEDIVHLWQLGLLKADLVVSKKKLNRVGLVDRGTDDYGHHVYSDERQLRPRSKGLANSEKALRPIQSGVELLFHPFRYYVLYGLNRVLEIHISRMQMFLQEGYHRGLDFILSAFNRWSSSDQFVPRIKVWNDVASLAIVTEPCMYVRIFRSIRFSPQHVGNMDNGVEETNKQIDEYWQEHIADLYQKIGIERLEEIRQDLCVATQMLDSNRWVHTMLCLGRGNLRTELKDCLGGALILRTMAETIRRATEKAFNTQLREEDELGFGWMPENVKAKVYGSNRLLDGDENVAREFMRQYELHYGLRLRFYVEGATESAALRC